MCNYYSGEKKKKAYIGLYLKIRVPFEFFPNSCTGSHIAESEEYSIIANSFKM